MGPPPVFTIRAALLWTINDFLARSSLSGWSGKWYLACPTCNKDMSALCVRNKIVYYDHCRYLSPKHSMRKREHYQIRNEKGKPSKKLSASNILEKLLYAPWKIPGKHPEFGGKKRKFSPNQLNWSKKAFSTSFEIGQNSKSTT